MSFKDYASKTLNDPLKQIEMQMGFLGGILCGVLCSGVFVLFFTDWEWYFKLFTFVGEIGIIGSLGLQFYNLIQSRKGYLEVQEEMNKVPDFQAPIALLPSITSPDKIKRKRRTKKEIQAQLKNDNLNATENLDSSNI